MTRQRVLLVDNSSTARSLMRIFLLNEPLDVFEKHTAAEALKTLENESFDLLIAGVTKPGMNGFELVKAVRAHQRPEVATMPVLFLTGDKAPDIEKQGLAAGANAVLTKPVTPAALKQTLQKLFEAPR